MIDEKDYSAIRQSVLSWPSEARFALLQELLRTFYPGKSYQQQPTKASKLKEYYSEMVGLLATERQLSDEDVEQILYEEKLKKLGLEE